jgi:hypothetical protein
LQQKERRRKREREKGRGSAISQAPPPVKRPYFASPPSGEWLRQLRASEG